MQHQDYMLHLATAAWRDRVITDLEHADPLEVARLGVPDGDALAILGQAEAAARQSGRWGRPGWSRAPGWY
jgi:hypothetical protein